MERKLVSIQKVESVEEISGADNIEKIKVLGWTLVAKKGEFQSGDLCVFFEVDSLLPKNNPNFSFMEKTNWRVKTMKMRGVISQGLALPLDILPLGFLVNPKFGTEDDLIGEDVTELLEVKKYEPPVKFHMGYQAGSFPYYVRKTDEIRVQSVPEVVNELKGHPYYITLKMDGTSMTVIQKDDEFLVCSRNMSLKEDDKSIYWNIAHKYNLKERFSKFGKNLCLQGEVCGPGIQQNRMGFSKLQWLVFDVYDFSSQTYGNDLETVDVVNSLGLESVPTLESGKFFNYSVDDLIEMSNDTYYSNGYPCEGIVVRAADNTFSPTLGGRISFKVINNNYLLKTGE